MKRKEHSVEGLRQSHHGQKEPSQQRKPSPSCHSNFQAPTNLVNQIPQKAARNPMYQNNENGPLQSITNKFGRSGS